MGSGASNTKGRAESYAPDEPQCKSVAATDIGINKVDVMTVDSIGAKLKVSEKSSYHSKVDERERTLAEPKVSPERTSPRVREEHKGDYEEKLDMGIEKPGEETCLLGGGLGEAVDEASFGSAGDRSSEPLATVCDAPLPLDTAKDQKLPERSSGQNGDVEQGGYHSDLRGESECQDLEDELDYLRRLRRLQVLEQLGHEAECGNNGTEQFAEGNEDIDCEHESDDRSTGNLEEDECGEIGGEGDDDDAGDGHSRGSAADLFAYSAMSLGIEGDELLFNMLYFGTGQAAPVGEEDEEEGVDVEDSPKRRPAPDMALRNLLNSTVEETVAAHSANNTPYKLNPAKDKDLQCLAVRLFDSSDPGSCSMRDCLICSDEFQNGVECTEIPACGHIFHGDCLRKWLSLQSWCPVCRTSITTSPPSADAGKMNEHSALPMVTGEETLGMDCQSPHHLSSEQTPRMAISE